MGASKYKPLNYQPPGARLSLDGEKLISKRRNEEIKIEVAEILHYQELQDWSDNNIEISMTEEDLRDQIIAKLPQLLGKKIRAIYKEFPTDNGPVDLLAIDEDYLCNVIEIKRKKAGLRGGTQLNGYVEHFVTRNLPHQGWLMSPAITQKTQEYLSEHALRWVPVQHVLQPSPP